MKIPYLSDILARRKLNSDEKIKLLLKDKEIDYLPYHFSLKKKLQISTEIKRIINKYHPINTSDHFSENCLKMVEKLNKDGIVRFPEMLLNKNQITEIWDFLKKENAYPAHIAYYDKEHPLKDVFNFKGKIASFNAETIIRYAIATLKWSRC